MKIANLETQLKTLHIPHFSLPWQPAISPYVESTEKDMLSWAASYGLFLNDDYEKRVVRTRYAWLAARCYPNATRELLQVIADYFVWFFLVDDLFVDRVETLSADTLPHLTAMIDVMDFNKAGPHPVYGELAWLDVCQRLLRLLSAEHFERFAQGMRLWATTAGLQILNHLNAQSADMRLYESIRRHTSGMNPCMALSDVANAGPVDPAIYHSPAIQQLCRYTNNIVCWSNDIQSVGIEAQQPGQFRNMVLIYAEQGHTLQEGVDYTATRVYEELARFIISSDELLATADAPLKGLIDGLKYWMKGYMDWVNLDTLRYSAVFAADDADDSGLL
ncbi:sesquiterpene cyclase [Chitinophaga sp. Cy-1792]|uniref:terpene synthase family protein n=1 Tax=Chitinophaga sp. Cy-1792 TaxID=2608339 RepID=UPI0014247CCB|nr:sesquiterpene cyclase [Chitinophaga sp. Cy-1792]NIG56423.1 sesquiterpene cyclase [Chitinophaga sp. Cy-1792]